LSNKENDPANIQPDKDNDGLTDARETTLGTDPLHPDSDFDGYTDGYEDRTGSDGIDSSVHPRSPKAVQNLLATSNAKFGVADQDGDGLPDEFEKKHGTEFQLADTDGDGVGDGAELINGTNPNSADPDRVDTDLDGLLDIVEDKYGTDKSSADTDRDGMPDPFEVLFSLDPRNPDSDGNGVLDGWDPNGGRYLYSPKTVWFPNWAK